MNRITNDTAGNYLISRSSITKRLCRSREKGVSYETHVALAGPPTFETYGPWYMRLNAGGTVPTLLIDDDSLSDSRDILEGLEARFKEPRLTPINAKQLADMQRWVEISYDLPERILAYGSGRLARLGAMVNAARRRALIKQREKNPDLDALYKDKIENIDAFIRQAGDANEVRSAKTRCSLALDKLDDWLKNRHYICGDSYSLADLVWTVTVARQHMLGAPPLPNRPALAAWYARMKIRPSFEQADVWENFHPSRLLPIIVEKFRWRALALVTFGSFLIGTLLIR